jgi:glycosyltransferase involved in cell wall biosynthesis
VGNITNKTNVIEKGISTLLIDYQYLSAIKKYFKNIKIDLIIHATPPITFTKTIRYIKKKYMASSYLLLKDIFPQNAVDLGMIKKNGIIHRYFRKKETELYASANYIGCMSVGNVDYLLKNNIDILRSKVEVCPNSIELRAVVDRSCMDSDNVKKKYGIPDGKTIFIYGGTLGKPQGIDFLVKCLRSNAHNSEICFVIVGSGTEYHKVDSFIQSEKPKNIVLIDQLTRDEYYVVLSVCDVGLIFLDHRFSIPNFPSRMLPYMEYSIPVLAATDTSTDVGKVIMDGKFGYWCESNDVRVFNEKVQLLCDKKVRSELGHNGRRYLEENYTAKHSYDIIVKHFE